MNIKGFRAMCIFLSVFSCFLKACRFHLIDTEIHISVYFQGHDVDQRRCDEGNMTSFSYSEDAWQSVQMAGFGVIHCKKCMRKKTLRERVR